MRSNITTLKYFLLGISVLLALAPVIQVSAQDTITVQTLTFDDITKRRDTYTFPSEEEKFRKILMVYTLKCDDATTQDGLPCGEWDYLTYNYVYDHDATFDSTYQSNVNFRVNGQERESFSYTNGPQPSSYTRYTHRDISHTSTNNLHTAQVGSGNSSTPFLKTSELSGNSVFVWTASELTAAGLLPGNITALRFDIANLGSEISNMKIRLKGTAAAEVDYGQRETGMEEVFFQGCRFRKHWMARPTVLSSICLEWY